MKRILSLFVVLLFISGCGGGGGGDSDIESIQEPLCPENVDESSYQDRNSWQYVEELCGNGSVISYSCQTENNAHAFGDNLDSVCEYLHEQAVKLPTEEIPEGATNYECPNRFDFSRFLYNTLNGELTRHFANDVAHYTPGGDQIARFNERPELGIAEGSTDFQENLVREAVRIVNGALPDEYNIRILPDKIQARQGRPPSGSIYVEFAPRNEWVDYGSTKELFGVTLKYNNEPHNRSIHIWVDSERTEGLSVNGMLWGILHELFHALGFPRHLEQTSTSLDFSFPVFSSMWDKLPDEGTRIYFDGRFQRFQFRENGILYPVDWWGLKYLYEELETGDSTDFYQGPNDLTYPEFDEWLREQGC